MVEMSEISVLRKQAEDLAIQGIWNERAVEINTRMLEIDDRAADAYNRLGRSFRELGRLHAAREMFKQVLSFDKFNSIANNAVIAIDESIGAEDENGIDIIKTIESMVSFDEAFTYGVAARRRRKYLIAVTALSKAVTLRPNSQPAQNALGAAYRHRGELDKAKKVYEDSLQISKNKVSQIGLAAVYRDFREYGAATALYNEVLSLDPNEPYALNGLGGVYSDIGQLDKAEGCFNRAVDIEEGRETAVEGLFKLMDLYELREDITSVNRIKMLLAAIGIS
jgi:tetratricopeptide (TPR) repeat protein